MGRESKLEVSSYNSPQSSGNLSEEKKDCKSQRRWRTPDEQGAMNQGSNELTEIEAASTGCAWVDQVFCVNVIAIKLIFYWHS